jgi:hypothetical protein
VAVAAQLAILHGNVADLIENSGAAPDVGERLLQNAAAFHAGSAGKPDAGINLAVAEHGKGVPPAAAQVSLAATLAADPHPERGVVVDGHANLLADGNALP